ncbi:MAG: PD-(D/E)XK nuclease family protein [Phormidesmis sp.]
MLPLSQSHLSQLSACSRKYQYIFFDTLSGPSTYEQHVTTQWGSQFHRLMQQQALNLPVNILSEADSEMAASLMALKEAAPDVFAYLPESNAVMDASHIGTFSQSEHRRTLAFNGYLLTVVYDLLVIENERSGHIFDWKTHQQPPKKGWLKQDWQTRLYLYVLCETSQLPPEAVSMTYWFVRLGKSSIQTREVDQAEVDPAETSRKAALQPSAYKFTYGLAQHDQTRRDLQRLTDELTKMRSQAHFPKVAIEKGLCDRCPFNVRCDRIAPTQAISHSLSKDPRQLLKAAQQLTIDSVQEIPL